MKRVLIAQFKHEGNGFNRNLTQLDAFTGQNYREGQAMLDYFQDVNQEPTGFVDVGREEGWEIVPALATFAPPSGPVADAAFETLCDKLVAMTKAALPLDGVLLSLHGAMIVESYPDSELEIVRRVRAVVGPEVPVFVSLDPHCNISRAMAEEVQGMFAFRTSPHVDQRKTGERTARMLAETFRRGQMPTCVLARRSMLQGFDGARTYHDYGPFLDAIRLAEGFEADPDILAVSINAGFSKTDSPVIGPSAAVTGFAPAARLQEAAEAMMDECWRRRGETSERIVSLEEARAALRAHKPGDRPLVLGDYGDSPAGGAYGDGTALLRMLLDEGATNAVLAPMCDPVAAKAAVAAGEGATIHLALGGRWDPDHGGGPIEADWTVVKVSDGRFVFKGAYGTGTTGTFGPSALIRKDGVEVMVIANQKGMFDLEQLRIFGVEPLEKDVLVIKSMQGYRAAFQPIASLCLDVDSGGISSPDPFRFDWKNVPRPIWPLDAEITG
ncbi:MAG: M81 family metallopeptidase [Pseudooceanicola sp.]|nr:M81 family metallopeptidase [Pseudooceanicola sp.]